MEEQSSPDEPQEKPVTDPERTLIRKEISSMSFEDLQKLKDKIGSKLYNETILGKPLRTPKTDFKRANKNRPREVSSKKRVPSVKEVQAKVAAPRDPRFDPLCGTFDKKVFRANYKFLRNVKSNEIKQLENELKETKNPKRKTKIKLLMQRIENQLREEQKNEKEDNEEYREKKEIKDKLNKGENPVFKKKSEMKLEKLINKYEELKKSNQLNKHIERRSKKLAHKDRKKFNQNNVIDL